MDPGSSRYLVVDYINHRLQRSGYEWENCPPLELQPTRIHQAMQTLATEFEERYSTEFEDMTHQLHITQDTAYPTFRAIVQELYGDGINWGRVVALFAFGGALATKSFEQHTPQLTDSVVEWVTTFISHNLDRWISDHGGWAGFVEFYAQGPERRNESPWPSLRQICGVAAGAIGVVVVGAFLTQKS